MSLVDDYKAQFVTKDLAELIKTRRTVIDRFLPIAEKHLVVQAKNELPITGRTVAPYLNMLHFSAALDELIAEKIYEVTDMTDCDVIECIEINDALNKNYHYAQEVLLQADPCGFNPGSRDADLRDDCDYDYALEAKVITDAACRDIAPESLANLVRYTFEITIGVDEVTSEQCMEVAQALLGVWDQKGLSGVDSGELLFEPRIDVELLGYDKAQ